MSREELRSLWIPGSDRDPVELRRQNDDVLKGALHPRTLRIQLDLGGVLEIPVQDLAIVYGQDGKQEPWEVPWYVIELGSSDRLGWDCKQHTLRWPDKQKTPVRRLTRVYPDTPAARAGLQAGDIIETIDGKRGVSGELVGRLRDAVVAGSRPGMTPRVARDGYYQLYRVVR